MTTTTVSDDRLIRWLIMTTMATFTLALHVTFPNMGGAGLRLPFNATVWIGFSLMIAISLWPMTRGVIRYSNFHIGLAILVAVLWLPFAWSWGEASLISLPRLLGLTAGALLLLGLAQLELTRRHWWWLGMSIFAGTLMETAYAYIQQFILEPGNWVGYDPNYGRPYGIFQQPNVLASFLATGLAISAWLYNESRNRIEAGITLLAPLFMPAMLLIIMSRTGWLATIIIVPMVLFYLYHQKPKRFLVWGGIFLAGCLFALLINSLGDSARSDTSIQSSGERYYVYTHSLRMIMEKPFLGWGYGRFQHDFLHSFADWRAAQPVNQPDIVEPFITQNYSHPHNELLLWGIEGGLLPIIAILVLTGWLGYKIWKHASAGERMMPAALITPLAIHSMTEYPFYHSQVHLLAFMLLVSAITKNFKIIHKKTPPLIKYIKRPLILTLSATTFLFMATNFHSLLMIKDYITSKGKEPQKINDIINFIGLQSEIERLALDKNLRMENRAKKETSAHNALNWGIAQSRLKPSPENYKMINRALNILSKENKKNQNLLEGSYLYPEISYQK